MSSGLTGLGFKALVQGWGGAGGEVGGGNRRGGGKGEGFCLFFGPEPLSPNNSIRKIMEDIYFPILNLFLQKMYQFYL